MKIENAIGAAGAATMGDTIVHDLRDKIAACDVSGRIPALIVLRCDVVEALRAEAAAEFDWVGDMPDAYGDVPIEIGHMKAASAVQLIYSDEIDCA